MEFYNNFNLRGRLLNPILLVTLILFNFFLIFFPSSGAFNLDFFVVFSFLVIVYEINKNSGILKIGNKEINMSESNRNLFFFIVSITLLTLAVVAYWTWVKNSTPDYTINKFIGIERVIHLMFSLVLMFVVYKTIYLDFGILIAIILFANLAYTLVTKNVLEMILNIDYLKFVFNGEDVRKEIETMVNNYQNGTTSHQNLELNRRILDKMLSFIGVLNNFFNILYFTVLVKIVGSKILKINVELSRIYFPRYLVWVFLANGVTVWILFSLSDFFYASTLSQPFSQVFRISLEVLLSFFFTLAFMYLLQGFSILFAYIKERRLQQLPLVSTQFLVFILVVIGISIFTNMGIVIFFNFVVVTLEVIGFTDYWVDYRKKISYLYHSKS